MDFVQELHFPSTEDTTNVLDKLASKCAKRRHQEYGHVSQQTTVFSLVLWLLRSLLLMHVRLLGEHMTTIGCGAR